MTANKAILRSGKSSRFNEQANEGLYLKITEKQVGSGLELKSVGTGPN